MTDPNKLYILWTTGDPVTAERMVLMYAANARLRDWWKEVTVIIWGAATGLVATDADIEARLLSARTAGVRFSACKACADQLGVTDRLLDLGIEVVFWGEPLTQILKNDERLITI